MIGKHEGSHQFQRIALVTNFPSYHNVDLFNALAQQPGIELKIFYLRQITYGRQWQVLREIQHPHEFIRDIYLFPRIYISPKLLPRVQEFNPDILIITQYASIGMQLLMYKWILSAKPWIFWSEAPGVQFTENKIINNDKVRMFLRKLALFPLHNAPCQIWAIGEYAKQEYQSVSNVPCINVPYYFNQDAFLNVMKGAKKSNEIVKFIYSGKQIYRKGFDILLDAIKLLVAEAYAFHVNVIGDTPDQQLYTVISKNNLNDYISFLGFKELDEVPQIYAANDVLIFPTRYDGWGMVVVEAMASGLPVISSYASVSAQNTIINNENGFLFENENSTQLAHYMRFFINHPEQIEKMGKHARKSVLKYSNFEGAKKMVRLIDSLKTGSPS
ncbi:MAG: glycosyltransferase family 4 protein [Ardenticatenaceae bacterium]|nr:glycosyltransferase family 4 protein [Ardenticatenaceae bacterium]MCB9005492.1 glycosyltransferase family 4 protein [Ardenticatenaceae bacterium]